MSRLHYRISAKVQPRKVILIPGLSSPLEVFHELSRKLEENGYEVLSFDWPGRGLSAPAPRQTLETLTLALEILLQDVGWTHATWDLVGFSWGAGFASHFALKHSKSTRSLLLLAPVGLRRSISFGTRLMAWPLVSKVLGANIGRRGLIRDFKLGFADASLQQKFIELFLEQSRRPEFIDAVLSSIRDIGFDFEDLFQRLGQQNFPVRVLAARHDHKLDPAFVPTLQFWIPKVQVKILEVGRHMLPLENSADVLAFILQRQ